MNTLYKDLFEKQRRVSTKGEVVILKKDALPVFVKRVQEDRNLTLEEKALLIVLVNTGARISEVVDCLKKRDIKETGYLTINVLKKRKEAFREAKIHFGWETVVQLLKHRKPQEFVFKLSRHQALSLVKKIHPELTCHAFRHNFISTLCRKNWSMLRISRLMNININTVSLYSHLNQKNELDSIFEDKEVQQDNYDRIAA